MMAVSEAIRRSQDSASERPAPAAAPHAPPADRGGAPVAVRIWLYGSLARAGEERPLEVRLPPAFSICSPSAVRPNWTE